MFYDTRLDSIRKNEYQLTSLLTKNKKIKAIEAYSITEIKRKIYLYSVDCKVNVTSRLILSYYKIIIVCLKARVNI